MGFSLSPLQKLEQVELKKHQVEGILKEYSRNVHLLNKCKSDPSKEKYEDILWNLEMVIMHLGFEFVECEVDSE